MTGTGGHAGSGGVMCGPVCDIFCQNGNVLDANGCPTCECNPPPPCLPGNCGPPPIYNPPVCAGTIVPGKCTYGPSGCAWDPPICEMCAALSCPTLKCANGYAPDANGCPTCQCSTCPPGSHAVSCPQVKCSTACVDGYVHDANGCQTCTCRQAPACAPGGVLCVTCRFGYRSINGCRTCACEDPPAGCLADP
jgi:hypothetical protein